MPTPLDPDHPIKQMSPEEKKALPENLSGQGSKVVAITTSGVAITEDGRFKKSKYFNVLTSVQDDYDEMSFTPEEMGKIGRQIGHLKHGASAAMPVICTGDSCPWRQRCVYWQIGKAPIGKQCLVELQLMKQWMLNFLEEYQVDIDNFTEMTLVSELVEVELQLYRCHLSLALDPEQATGVMDVNIGFDNQGNPVTQKQISQLIELKEKLTVRKHKLIKMLVGDRQEKYKREAALKVREARDPSSSMAQLKEQMEGLQRELGKAAEKIPIQGQVLSAETATESLPEDPSSARGGPLTPEDLLGRKK